MQKHKKVTEVNICYGMVTIILFITCLGVPFFFHNKHNNICAEDCCKTALWKNTVLHKLSALHFEALQYLVPEEERKLRIKNRFDSLPVEGTKLHVTPFVAWHEETNQDNRKLIQTRHPHVSCIWLDKLYLTGFCNCYTWFVIVSAVQAICLYIFRSFLLSFCFSLYVY